MLSNWTTHEKRSLHRFHSLHSNNSSSLGFCVTSFNPPVTTQKLCFVLERIREEWGVSPRMNFPPIPFSNSRSGAHNYDCKLGKQVLMSAARPGYYCGHWVVLMRYYFQKRCSSSRYTESDRLLDRCDRPTVSAGFPNIHCFLLSEILKNYNPTKIYQK